MVILGKVAETNKGEISIAITKFQDTYATRLGLEGQGELNRVLVEDRNIFNDPIVVARYDGLNQDATNLVYTAMERLVLGEEVDLTNLLA